MALDSTPGQLDRSDGFFPQIGTCDRDFQGDQKAMWRSFLSIRRSIDKANATKVEKCNLLELTLQERQVGEAMHDTYLVSKDDPVSEVANLLVRKNAQRVFVLDENGRLCGVVARGDILKVTMDKYK